LQAVVSDKQCLERVGLEVVRLAYPAEHAVVERRLMEMRDLKETRDVGRVPSWKAAIHLACALLAPKQSEDSWPAAFLHQDKKYRPHVAPTLEEVSLMKDLAWLLVPDRASLSLPCLMPRTATPLAPAYESPPSGSSRASTIADAVQELAIRLRRMLGALLR
jgi:hypothetical protein